jgi:hypothetical protein
MFLYVDVRFGVHWGVTTIWSYLFALSICRAYLGVGRVLLRIRSIVCVLLVMHRAETILTEWVGTVNLAMESVVEQLGCD